MDCGLRRSYLLLHMAWGSPAPGILLFSLPRVPQSQGGDRLPTWGCRGQRSCCSACFCSAELYPGDRRWGAPGGSPSSQQSPFAQAGSQADHRQEAGVAPTRLAEKSAASLSLTVTFEPQLNGSAPIDYLLKQKQPFQNVCRLSFCFY